MDIYQRNFKKLTTICDLEKVKESEYLKYTSQDYKDLHIEFSKGPSNSKYGVILGHYYVLNGDLVPDPSFEVEIDEDLEKAEVFKYQDLCAYVRVDNLMYDKDNFMIVKYRSSINSMFETWLDKLIMGNFKLANEQKWSGWN